ncbi:MAG: hypothetical protein JXX14_03840 [Deltaproteobacteria bacterium]|nr:hypothetical protein [Deltaproteobacteria bacterium]
MTIVWQKNYNVNVLEIDEQYLRLVDSFNQLVRLVKRGVDLTEISILVELVQEQSQICFNSETVYFSKLGFSDFDAYRQGHSSCLIQLSHFKKNYDQQQPLINLAHVEGIARALLGHVATSHSAFNDFMKKNRISSFIRAHA